MLSVGMQPIVMIEGERLPQYDQRMTFTHTWLGYSCVGNPPIKSPSVFAPIFLCAKLCVVAENAVVGIPGLWHTTQGASVLSHIAASLPLSRPSIIVHFFCGVCLCVGEGGLAQVATRFAKKVHLHVYVQAQKRHVY